MAHSAEDQLSMARLATTKIK